MDCAQVPDLKYGEFSKNLMQRVGSRRIPLMGSIETTWRCNLKCAHCYLNLPAGDQAARARELSSSEWRRIIDEIVEEGCLWLLLTGGEPLLRPDFLEVYTYAKQQGLLITLFTNATLITPVVADHLAAWRPFDLEISIYGGTKQTYEAVTGVPGSYDQCLKGIHLLLERKINLTLKTMVLTLNRHEFTEMQNLATGLGVKFRYDALLNPRLDGSRAPCAFRLLPEQVVELDVQDTARLKEWRDFTKRFLVPPDSEALFNCGAGARTFHIDPYGNLSACTMARHPDFQLLQGSFKQGWEDFLLQMRRQKRQKESPCASCNLFFLCGHCPGWSQLEHDDQEQLVEYLCRIAHLRAEAFGANRYL